MHVELKALPDGVLRWPELPCSVFADNGKGRAEPYVFVSKRAAADQRHAERLEIVSPGITGERASAKAAREDRRSPGTHHRGASLTDGGYLWKRGDPGAQQLFVGRGFFRQWGELGVDQINAAYVKAGLRIVGAQHAAEQEAR